MEELDLIDETDLYEKESSMVRLDNRTILISVLSGGCSGLLTDLIYFPLDSIKTRIQATTSRTDFVKKTENLSKMKGMSAIMIVSVPYAMTFFLFYDKTKQIISQKTNLNHSIIHMIGAIAGETMGGLVRNPFEVIKQQMQVGWNNSFKETCKEIFKISGFKGFFAGYFSLILREVPFSTIQFPIYEYMKKKALKKRKKLSFYDNSINGFVSGSIAAFLTNPIDVVKTRLMTQRDKYYKNTWGCFKTVYNEEGWKGFVKGIHIRTPAVGFTGIIFFGLYEKTKLIIDKLTPNF